MDNYVENVFLAMVQMEDNPRALDFLTTMPVDQPTQLVFEELVHGILENPKGREATSRGFLYLMQRLLLDPPCNEARQLLYKQVLFEYNEGTMFDGIIRLINCSLRQCGISKVVECSGDPCWNCPTYLKYLVQVFQANLDAAVSARDVNIKKRTASLSHGDEETSNSPSSLPLPLVCDLFWESGRPESCNCSRNLQKLIDITDPLYYTKEKTDMREELTRVIRTLLNIALKSVVLHYQWNELSVLDGINCPPLTHALNYIYGGAIPKTVENLEGFLDSIQEEWLRIKVCDTFLGCLIHDKSQNFGRKISLKNIVNCFMLRPVKEERDETDGESPGPSKRKKLSPETSTGKKKVFTKLHQMCLMDKPASLLELLLDDSQHINVRNDSSQTPLHVACFYRSYSCAKVLLEGGFPEKADVYAQDRFGNTSLHIAVNNESRDIIQLLLEHGGKELASMKNKAGHDVLSMTEDTEIKSCLRTFCQNVSAYEPTRRTNRQPNSMNIVPINDKVALYPVVYSDRLPIYVICLQTLLANYISFFRLQKPCARDDSEAAVNSLEEDERLLLQFSEIVEHFATLLHKLSDSGVVEEFIHWMEMFDDSL